MLDTAKLFVCGNSQAVPKPDDLQHFFALLEAAPVASAAFVPPRDDTPAADPLASWNDEPPAGTGP